MLLGLAVIAAPLLFAVVDAGLQIRTLAQASQNLVQEGVLATRYSQDLFAGIAALERTARLYQVLDDAKLLEAYGQNDERLARTRALLGRHLKAPDALESLRELEMVQREVRRDIALAAPGPSSVAGILPRIDRMSELAARIAERGNAQIDAELGALQERTERAQRRLFWQSALLVPFSFVAILVLTLVMGRPLRQIDRAISELGRGAFSNPVSVSGPRDLERLGRQLEWLRVRLIELAQERNRFLRHMSHELKTPLANIREGTELLMDGAVGELDSSQREVTAILRDNGIRLQRLIENLLSFSAWQSQNAGLEVSEFRVRPLVKQVLENQQLTLLSQRVRLDVQVDDLTLHADRGKMRLIFENLLSNAIKYSPKGGTIHVHAKATGNGFILDVADSGPGIPAEDRARIFEAFYTGKAPTGGHVKGTGIGLSVVMEFVGAHGGTIEIVDGKFPGAHFRIRMPIRVERSDARGSAGASGKGPVPQAGKGAGSGAPPAPPRPRAASVALVWMAVAFLAGCGTGFGARDDGAAAAVPAVDRAAAQAQLIASYLETLARLANGAPAEQAEIFAGTKREFEVAPTASHQLRYALALATNGHGSHDPALAQRLLRELLATPETLLPAERALAFLELQHVDRLLALSADVRRLQTEVGRGDRERAAAAQRRLQAMTEENAQLRRALEEARAKLDAIADIEGRTR
jgi:two-component system sensor histidine kinase GlrK